MYSYNHKCHLIFKMINNHIIPCLTRKYSGSRKNNPLLHFLEKNISEVQRRGREGQADGGRNQTQMDISELPNFCQLYLIAILHNGRPKTTVNLHSYIFNFSHYFSHRYYSMKCTEPSTAESLFSRCFQMPVSSGKCGVTIIVQFETCFYPNNKPSLC